MAGSSTNYRLRGGLEVIIHGTWFSYIYIYIYIYIYAVWSRCNMVNVGQILTTEIQNLACEDEICDVFRELKHSPCSALLHVPHMCHILFWLMIDRSRRPSYSVIHPGNLSSIVSFALWFFNIVQLATDSLDHTYLHDLMRIALFQYFLSQSDGAG